MVQQAAKVNIVAMTQIPLYSLTDQQIEGKINKKKIDGGQIAKKEKNN
jgi:hypothetical protein